MLTQEEIDAMDKVTGWSSVPTVPVANTQQQPTTINSPVVSRADEVRQKIAEARKLKDGSYQPDTTNLDNAQTVSEAFKGFFKDVAFNTTKMNKTRGDMGSTIQNSADLVNKGEQTIPEALVQTIASSAKQAAKNFISPITVGAKHIAGAVGDIITAGREAQKKSDAQDIAAGILKPENALSNQPHFEDTLKHYASLAVDEIVAERDRQKALNPDNKDVIDLYKESSPRTKANIKALTDTAQATADFYGGVKGAEQTANIIYGTAGKTMELVNNTKNSMQTKAVNSLEDKYNELSGTTKSNRKLRDKVEKVTGYKNAAGTVGRTPQRVLAENGIVPELEGTKLSTLKQAEDLKTSAEPLNVLNKENLANISKRVPQVNLNEQRKLALKEADSVFNRDSGVADSLIKEINGEYDSLIAKYDENIPLDKLNDIKVARGTTLKYDSLRPHLGGANDIIRKTAQNTIENVAEKAGYSDVAQLNREIGDILEASKFLAKLDGTTVKGGQITRLAGMIIGASSQTGIVGKIAGALGGDMAAKMLINASVAGPVKRLLLSRLQQTDPKAYTAALIWLKENGQLKDIRLALPPASAPAKTIKTTGKVFTAKENGDIYAGVDRAQSVAGESPEMMGAKAIENLKSNMLSDLRAKLATGGGMRPPIAENKTSQLTDMINKFVKDFTPADVKKISNNKLIYDEFTQEVFNSVSKKGSKLSGHELLGKILDKGITK